MTDDVDSPRLRAERERLFRPGDDGRVRALVLALARPADWEVLGRPWKGVQEELGWPAPGIAVSGTDACQLWFSLAEPLPVAQAHALLEAVRLRFLAEVPAHRIELIPSADGERQVPRVPALMGEEAWSAYVAPDLAPVFAETPWLDIPPRAEGQAELLSRLRPISAAECRMLLPDVAQVAPDAAPAVAGVSAPAAVAPAVVFTDPQAFLLQVMNDERVEMALRIEAAKVLLAVPARAGTTARKKAATPDAS
jgi:hypothetical protein